MAGTLTLTVGPLTATKTLNATAARLDTAIRDAAKYWGYPGDVESDPAQDVADWFVGALVVHARNASRGLRVQVATESAQATAVGSVDPFDE